MKLMATTLWAWCSESHRADSGFYCWDAVEAYQSVKCGVEIVEAGRWLSQNSSLNGKALAEAAAMQPWDASVQALVMFPDLLKRLNQDFNWTSELGNVFLAQQDGVASDSAHAPEGSAKGRATVER